MNQTALHHLRALEAHHSKVLNSVRDLIRLETGDGPVEKHEVIIPSNRSPLPAPCSLLNRSETHRLKSSKPRSSEDIVIDALSILEQNTFSTGDVLRAIKAAFPSEWNSRRHTCFRKELANIARTGIIRLEQQGSGGRGSKYSK